MEKMNKRILVLIVLAVLLALPAAAQEEKKQAIIDISEAVTLFIVLASAVMLFMLSSILARGLKTGIILLAFGLFIYGIISEAMEIAEKFLSLGIGLYAQITAIIGSIIFLMGCFYLYRTVNQVRQKQVPKKN
ncbi:MAG: hypothetical protein KAI26_08445 [Nanoarchaeota archaeon]|nr:hypothetical protein [Nanoarchaeota archaeon]